MVKDGAFSHSQSRIFSKFLGASKSPRASKSLHWVKSYGGFGEAVKLHREGSAPAACAAVLFIRGHDVLFVLKPSQAYTTTNLVIFI